MLYVGLVNFIFCTNLTLLSKKRRFISKFLS